ncbi:MAG: hypothetical protein KO202_06930 [Methanobacteriaceae archaeon]|nr:hypothetical protein [Methanobacteriaceae archaeon]
MVRYYNKKEILLSVENIVMMFKNGTKYIIKAVDNKNSSIANLTLIISVNYTKITDKEGLAILNINLFPNNYPIITFFKGSDIYNKNNIRTNLTILIFINPKNLIKYYRNGFQFQAKVLDNNANPLKNVNVT